MDDNLIPILVKAIKIDIIENKIFNEFFFRYKEITIKDGKQVNSNKKTYPSCLTERAKSHTSGNVTITEISNILF